MKTGEQCIVNGRGDLAMIYEARPFIRQACTIIKICKSGLIQVSLNSNPELTRSFPKFNITLDG